MLSKLQALCLAGLTLTATGCASLNSSVPFQYQPSLSAGKTVQKSAGFNLLEDLRPEADRSYTKSIKDVSEKITAKLIEDFQRSKVFQDIHYPITANDDLIIDGKVSRFMWKFYAEPILYIPYVNIITLFGIPTYKAYGVTEIELELKDRSTGQMIGNVSANSRVENSYNIYNFKAGEAGAELAESFRDVAKKLKEGVIQKLK